MLASPVPQYRQSGTRSTPSATLTTASESCDSGPLTAASSCRTLVCAPISPPHPHARAPHPSDKPAHAPKRLACILFSPNAAEGSLCHIVARDRASRVAHQGVLAHL